MMGNIAANPGGASDRWLTAPHIAIKASAGSGKTHRLIVRLLWLLRNGARPSEILASTFTRKAASEILQRLLGSLARAVTDESHRQYLATELGGQLPRARCESMLLDVVRALDQLNILTLDAFLHRLASAHALELGLPPSWRILDEEDALSLMEEALAETLEGPNPPSPDAASAIMHALHGDRDSADIHASLVRLAFDSVGSLGDDAALPDIWGAFPPPVQPLPELRLAQRIQDLEAESLPLKSTGIPHVKFKRAFERSLEEARRGNWSGFLGGIAAKIMASERAYDSAEISPSMRAAYGPLIDHARAVLLAEFHRRNMATGPLIKRFAEAVEQLKLQRGVIEFGDLARRLLGFGESGADVQQLYYSSEGRLRHVLLDEFQDTSAPQFRVLEPLLDEALSDADHSAFFVGDIKQSLYTWRRAAPEILLTLDRRWRQISVEPLSTSYRSAQTVLDAVDTVFGRSAGLGGGQVRPRIVAYPAARDWFDTYEPHRAARDLAGVVRVVRMGDIESDDSDDGILSEVSTIADRVAHLRQVAPTASIGILPRRTKYIAVTLAALKERGIDASEEGGNPLTDSPAVAAVLSLLHVLEHPGDTMALFHVMHTPLGRLTGVASDAEPAAALLRLRQRIAASGIFGFLRGLFPDLAPTLSARDRERFEQLLDVAGELEQKEAVSPAHFRHILRQRHVEAAGPSRVRVMTIHRAKGLEFDAVVLPDLGRAWRPMAGRLLLDRPSAFDHVQRASQYPNKVLRACDERLETLFQRAMNSEVLSEICCLYVSMTRARHHLEMIIPKQNTDSELLSAAALLRERFGIADGAPKGIVWETPEARRQEERWAAWVAHSQRSSPDPVSPPHSSSQHFQPRIATPAESARRRTSRALRRQVAPSRAAHAAPMFQPMYRAMRPRSPSESVRLPAAEYGVLLHRLLARLTWLDVDEFDCAREVDSLGESIDSGTQARLQETLARLVAGRVGRVLRRAEAEQHMPPGAALSLHSEWTFAASVTENAGGLRSVVGVIDRLELAQRAGRAVWARIADFKSDDVADDHIAERAGAYEAQMREYRTAVKALFGLEDPQIRTILLFTSADRVVEVEP